MRIGPKAPPTRHGDDRFRPLTADAVRPTVPRGPNVAAPGGGDLAMRAAVDSPRASNPVASRAISGHLASLGIFGVTQDPIAAIRARELELARAADPRVEPGEMARAIARAEQALSVVPAPQSDLFGFTRLVDAKLRLDEKAISALVQAALDRRRASGLVADPQILLEAIANGPGDHEIVWRRPATPAQLVASLVRQLVLGGGASAQLRLTQDLVDWVRGTLEKAQTPVQKAMGGAGGFAANLASSLPSVETTFYSAGDLPPEVAERFSPAVRMLSASGDLVPAAARTDPHAKARINYSAEYPKDLTFQILGRTSLVMDGAERPLVSSGGGRVILGSPGTTQAAFRDLSEGALARVARAHDLFFVSGTHHHTETTPGATPESEVLARELDIMRAANPRLLVHLQYVVPKVPDNEPAMLRTLVGKFDSISLNSVELAGLLSRLRGAGMTSWSGESHPEREVAERPSAVLAGAIALKDALRVQRVHVHGYLGDLLIADGVKDPERQVLAFLRARQLATIKAAADSGEIRSPHDVVPVAPTIEGKGLAAVHAFADSLGEHLHLDARALAAVVDRWWHRDPATGRLYAFVPTRGIHDATGGTVSLGDTIDAAALIHGLSTDRGRSLLHPAAQSFGAR